jgi:AcrR family transcriptional regulator
MAQHAAEAPVSARRAQTRERLMQAAAAVFADRGVYGATVEEITDAAGFTRGAFYSNFADKSELVLAMLTQSMADQFAVAQQAIDDMKAGGNASADELIHRALSALERADRPSRVGVLLDQELKLHAAREPALHAAYLEFTATSCVQLEALIGDALAYLGLELTIPFDHALRMIIAVHEHEQHLAVFSDAPTDNGPMRTLLLTITRPVPGAPAGAAAGA